MDSNKLHQEAIVFDAHNDTLLDVLDNGRRLAERGENVQIDIPRLYEGGATAMTFATFVDQVYHPVASKRALQTLDAFYNELAANEDKLCLATKAADIEAAKAKGKVAAVLSLEGVEALMGELGTLRMFYRLGIRMVSLTWNWRNAAADGLYEKRSGGGLTTFGVSLIEELNRLGIIVDVAHLAPAGVRDVLAITQAPIIVSHGNAQALCGHARNISDEQLEAIARNGGVVCASFVPEFLEPDAKQSSLSVWLDHVDHIVKVAGPDHVGLGSDFDGMFEWRTIGAEDASKLPNVTAGLLERGHSPETVLKILGGNLLRVFRQVAG